MDLSPINSVATKIEIILGNELINLKRKASGALINSLQHEISPLGEFGFDLKIKALDYWRVVEYGVDAAKIPFSPNQRTGAANSKYIDGLIQWIKVKGIASDNDVIRGIAFAIATKQAAQSKGGFGLGNPMNKQKLGFVRKSEEKINKELQSISKIYESEVLKIISSELPNNIEIII